MMYLDRLPYYDLCHVLKYLGVEDLKSVSALSSDYEETAIAVAQRYHCTYTLVEQKHTADQLRLLCQFLAKFVRTLTVQLIPPPRDHQPPAPLPNHDCIISLITNAVGLVDLTIINPMNPRHFYNANYFGRIRRLTLRNSVKHSELGGMLATCTDGTLKELNVENICSDGAFLRRLNVQLDVLRIRNVKHFEWQFLHELNYQYPRLKQLEVIDDDGEMQRLTMYLHDRACQMQRLALLPELHTLYIPVDNSGLDFIDMTEAMGSQPNRTLRHLHIEARNSWFTEELGRHMHHLAGLETLQVHAFKYVFGLADMLRGLSKHPTLRELRLVGEEFLIVPLDQLQQLEMPNTATVHADKLQLIPMVPFKYPHECLTFRSVVFAQDLEVLEALRMFTGLRKLEMVVSPPRSLRGAGNFDDYSTVTVRYAPQPISTQ